MKDQKFDNQAVRKQKAIGKVRSLVKAGSRLNMKKASGEYLQAVMSNTKSGKERKAVKGEMFKRFFK